MRKSNKVFASRGDVKRNENGAPIDVRTNYRARQAHSIANNKFYQYLFNFRLQVLLEPFLPKLAVPTEIEGGNLIAQ